MYKEYLPGGEGVEGGRVAGVHQITEREEGEPQPGGEAVHRRHQQLRETRQARHQPLHACSKREILKSDSAPVCKSGSACGFSDPF